MPPPQKHSQCCGCAPQTAKAAQGRSEGQQPWPGMGSAYTADPIEHQSENLYWWQVGEALLSPGVFRGEDRFFSWGKAGTPADLCGFTPVEQLGQGSPAQSAPNSLLPSGTGSAPSQREGCHLQHCAQRFLQHHGLPWTSPSEELIRASPLKWRLGDSSMTEIGNVLKLVSYFRNAEEECLK